MSASVDPSPLRVVRIITRLNIGGPSIQAIGLSTRLNPWGFETRLVHGQLGKGEGDMRYLLDPEAAPPVHLPALRREVAPAQDLRACLEIYRLLCRYRPAIVHTHTAKAGTVGRIAAVAYNRTGGRHRPARIIHTYHGHVFDGYFSRRSTEFFVRIERALARWTDAIVAISPQIQHDLHHEHGIGREAQFAIIPLGFDLDPFVRLMDADRTRAREALSILPGVPVVTWVGRLTGIKEPRLFLEMARVVALEQPQAVFLIVGDGELRSEVERLVSRPPLAGRVLLLGWRRDLTTIYGATDVFVLTSRNEGTPVALIEAMASGVAGVSTDVGGVRDVLNDNRLGTLVPFGDGGALGRAVTSLLSSPGVRREMGEYGRASVVSRYSLDRLLKDLAALYRRSLETPALSARRRD